MAVGTTCSVGKPSRSHDWKGTSSVSPTGSRMMVGEPITREHSRASPLDRRGMLPHTDVLATGSAETLIIVGMVSWPFTCVARKVEISGRSARRAVCVFKRQARTDLRVHAKHECGARVTAEIDECH